MKNSKIFNKLRGAARNVGDFQLMVRLLALIACVTGKKEDIDAALESARQHGGHQSGIAEALATIVSVLVKAGRYHNAREVVGNHEKGIPGDLFGQDTYWHAEAAILLARGSKDPDDYNEAVHRINRIRNEELRREARCDLDMPEEDRRSIDSTNNPLFQLVALVSELTSGQIHHNTGYLHKLIDRIVDDTFASKI